MDILGAVTTIFCTFLAWWLDKGFNKLNASEIVKYSTPPAKKSLYQVNHFIQNESQNNNTGNIYNHVNQGNTIINNYSDAKNSAHSSNEDPVFIMFFLVTMIFCSSFLLKDRFIYNVVTPIAILVLIVINYAVYSLCIRKFKFDFDPKQNFLKSSFTIFGATLFLCSDILTLLFSEQLANVEQFLSVGLKLDLVVTYITNYSIPLIYVFVKLLITVFLILMFYIQILRMIKSKHSTKPFRG